eukprot:GHVO01017334.1.p2 GENE.GHVO01017334.1~~GHVO01017334.1.p2  ORF type:complete len:101 (-),score=17.95 GHVO01017334.1:248-550(-)
MASELLVATTSDLELASDPDDIDITPADGSKRDTNSTVIALSVVAGTLGCLAIALSVALINQKRKKKLSDATRRPLLGEEGGGEYGAFDGDADNNEVCQS